MQAEQELLAEDTEGDLLSSSGEKKDPLNDHVQEVQGFRRI